MSTKMSLISLFFNASFLVQCVMLMLLLASIFSWMFIFQRGQFFRQCRTAIKDFETAFWSGADLGQLYNKLSMRQKNLFGLSAIFVSGFKEFIRIRKQNPEEPEVILQGVERSMKIAFIKEIEQLEKNLPFLATVQSMSPFIGLFGTVWGIMHAFRELGAVQQATLAMVAPGISEALVATAMGLIAAIPAGIAYNRYISRVDSIVGRYQMFVDELTAIMHRRIYANIKNSQSDDEGEREDEADHYQY